MSAEIGQQMHKWMHDLFPIHRSLTGNGVRKTLDYIKKELPELNVHAIASGSSIFDWTVPDEWNIREAWIANSKNEKLIDIKNNNLHVMGYSIPIDTWMTKEQLQPNLFSLPNQPDAIPYVTSYYAKNWGFCLTQNQFNELPPNEPLHVKIDSELEPGQLNYADFILPGETEEEILLSTYICHPSMANNELSGPVVALALAQWLKTLHRRRYTYRFVFVPETIGAIVYLSKHIEHLKKNVVAGYVLTCLGDERTFSFLPSRKGNSISDRAALLVLRDVSPDFIKYSYLQRGSDERQYCSPGVDLPIASVMRSKYGCYPEYHTSLDDLNLVTPTGLAGGFGVLQQCLLAIEGNNTYRMIHPCEPQLGKRGLYPQTSTANTQKRVENMMNVIGYSDGENDCISISDITGVPLQECIDWCRKLTTHGVMEKVS
ncbi:DUF4910 domain-containing protein [Aeromonas hydrophila]|uniref:DUF4910 domain-containing protein n=1 Tax=Aeromonas hydrophila TaxID=644 RepID=UPI000A93A3B2|nr:DUF4910 domain-containing protein [Aeromonas hydrophila]HDX8383913.1 DUF4910 domain-containing protein [Aeromonas hydrophila]